MADACSLLPACRCLRNSTVRDDRTSPECRRDQFRDWVQQNNFVRATAKASLRTRHYFDLADNSRSDQAGNQIGEDAKLATIHVPESPPAGRFCCRTVSCAAVPTTKTALWER